VSWAVFYGLKKTGCKRAIAVFAAAALGDLVTYVVTSVQLGVVYGGMAMFMGVFAVTQIPLAIAEGLLTVVVYGILEKYSAAELRQLGVL
jgi:cobalt/nickel transport system permease protein